MNRINFLFLFTNLKFSSSDIQHISSISESRKRHRSVGKDSWSKGNFGNQVLSFKLLTASGEIKTVTSENEKPLFQAVIGGMGLLGIIVEITLQLTKIPSPFVEVTSVPTANITESIQILEEIKDDAFSVVWVDAFAKEKGLGRGFVSFAKWVEHDEVLSPERLTQSLTMPTKIFGLLPAKPTWFLGRPFFRPWGIRLVNILNYNWSRFRMEHQKSPLPMLFTDYNFMHKKIPDLKHVYRPHGFLEFQPIIPRACGVEGVIELFKLCQRHHCESLLCALKIHQDDEFMISYASEGYSISIDFQVAGRNPKHIEQFSRDLFQFTLDCGGKTYLAKDELLPRDIFLKIYPRFQEFLDVKQQVDSTELFASDMYRRLLKPN